MKHPDAHIEAALVRLASPTLATIDLSLDRITRLLAALGNPQDKLPPVIHVAGTNGKGSLVAYLTAIFQAGGYSVHRYISPHLVYFNERIVIKDHEISNAYLRELLGRVEAAVREHPVTFFEATTAMGFLAFAENPADIVLLETGLGGRLDATNMVRAPKLVAITPISIDHTEYLGNSLAGIAAEKAGIIKPGAPCVLGPQTAEAAEILTQKAHAVRASLYRYGHEWDVQSVSSGFWYHSPLGKKFFPYPVLPGVHQLANAGTAIACAEQLLDFTVTDEHIQQGLARAEWPGRLQKLAEGSLAQLLPGNAELWLDGGHNPSAGVVIGEWVRTQTKPVHIICGMLKNKDISQFLAPLVPYVRSLTAVSIEGEPQSQNPEVIANAARGLGITGVVSMPAINIKNTIEEIVKKEENSFILLICGSLYLAGNILWQNNQ